MSRIARNLEFKECIPNSIEEKWFQIDIIKNKFVIKLD
jgi:hypothetical protein